MAEAGFFLSPARVFARPTADPIWLGPAQRAALSQLSREARIRLLVGTPSSGKSTLLNHVARQLGSDSVVLHCRGPKEDAAAVLAQLLVAADLAPWELSEVERRNLFTVFVQQRRAQGKRVVLIVDDAHVYKPAAWEERERLLVYKIDRLPAVEILIAGPQSLTQLIDSPRNGLNPTDVTAHRLDAPTTHDLVKYIEWRLARFEMSNVITPVACQMIAKLSGGRYAAVDLLSQMALLLLRRLNLERVDARVARQAIAALAARQSAKIEATDQLKWEQPLDTPPQAHLLISRDGRTLTRVALGQRTLLGRSEHNDVRLPSPYLSRHHCAFVGTPEGYYVVDLNSANGLLLNGRQVERAVLCDQDVLTVGPFRMKVQIPEWLARGSPLPGAESLSETALMPRQPEIPAAIRVIK